ncbi:MAG: hypothetical protein LBE84_01620 [Planctomycetota bacterium]|nr:hypothetical protein [Planctomycetota bacterium]
MSEDASSISNDCERYWAHHRATANKQLALWAERDDYDPGAASIIPPKPNPVLKEEVEGFGYKTGWLAFQSDFTERVPLSLGIPEPEWQSWAEGLTYSGLRLTHKLPAIPCFLAVTPPISGWVLVQGTDFVDRFFEIYKDGAALNYIAEWSRAFGKVQYFVTY